MNFPNFEGQYVTGLATVICCKLATARNVQRRMIAPARLVRFSPGELSRPDYWIRIAFGGLARWDAVHFLHIAHYGYTFENSLAFFPLFPTLIHYLTLIWSWTMPFIHFSSALILTAVTLNFVVFILCGQLLYALCLLLTKSIKVALIASIIFSLNPASIFFSAIYSEGIYMLFTLSAMFTLYADPGLPFIRHVVAALLFSFAFATRLNPASIFFSAIYSEGIYMLFTLSAMFTLYADPGLPFIRHVVAALLFSFAFATRSNGILNFGYIMFQLLVETIYSASLRKYIWQRDCGTVMLKVLPHGTRTHNRFCSSNATSNSSTELLPDSVRQYAVENNLVLPDDLKKPIWCKQKRSMLNPMPVFYVHIQKKYWQVEPFGYWQLKKLPCFLMASPVVFFVAYGSLVELNRLRTLRGSLFVALWYSLQDPCSLIPFLVHSLLLTALALVLYNVEVLTRITFSSSPFIYLVLAQYMDHRTPLITLEDVQYPTLLPFLTNFSRTHWSHLLLLLYLL
ncbi:unnamed protein product, partial [Gongylonema pulchrum]|uniref:GPI mannosyltransferase 2 n=1 Tax=Gongylonema pulchrum TaxID=637853 RepID=A0A183DST3_9BILA